MQDKVDLAVHSLSARHGDSLNELISLGIAALTLLIVLAPLITPRNYKTNMSSTINPLVDSSSVGYGDSLSTTQRITLNIAALTLLLGLAVCGLSIESSNSINTAKRIAFYITAFILPFYLPLLLRSSNKTNMSSTIIPLVHISNVGYGNIYTTTQWIASESVTALTLQAACNPNLNTASRIAFGIAWFILPFCPPPLIRPHNYRTNISSEISPVVHSSSAWYRNIYTTTQRIALKTVTALTLQAACNSNLNTASRITFGIAWFILQFGPPPLIRPHHYRTNISSEISPVVHSSSAWYRNIYTTTQRIALKTVAALTLLASCNSNLNTAGRIKLGIVWFILLFYLLPLVMSRNYKANISSEISPVVHSSSVEHGDNKPPLLSRIRYHRPSPFHYSGLASRCPRPRMIVRT